MSMRLVLLMLIASGVVAVAMRRAFSATDTYANDPSVSLPDLMPDSLPGLMANMPPDPRPEEPDAEDSGPEDPEDSDPDPEYSDPEAEDSDPTPDESPQVHEDLHFVDNSGPEAAAEIVPEEPAASEASAEIGSEEPSVEPVDGEASESAEISGAENNETSSDEAAGGDYGYDYEYYDIPTPEQMSVE